MNLKDIHMTLIDQEAFLRTHFLWYDEFSERKETNKAEITQYLTYPDYNQLIKSFLGCEFAHRLLIIIDGKREKYYVGDLKRMGYARILAGAEKDKYQVGHIELTFKPRGAKIESRIKIGRKENGQIMAGYHLRLSANIRHAFTWEGNFENSHRTLAICVPEDNMADRRRLVPTYRGNRNESLPRKVITPVSSGDKPLNVDFFEDLWG